MFGSIAVLGLAATALAGDKYPEISSSKAYRLVVNVTETTDFTPGVHGTELGLVATEGAAAFRVVTVAPGTGSVFFSHPDPEAQPGEINAEWWRSTVTNNGGRILGLQAEDINGQHLRFNMTAAAGSGDSGATVKPEGPIYWANPTVSGMFIEYIVCNATVEGGRHAVDALAWSSRGPSYSLHLPDDCLRTKMFPQCDTVENVAGGGLSDEVKAYLAAAEEIPCYKDVRAIDWSKYDNH
ncbi:hypothetical protein OQA88_7731 [Cercophora sp. LCS_1]